MATIDNGILGKSKGKIGPVITASWKSLNVVKQYFIPANPKTPLQQTQRSKFAQSVEYARQLLTTVVKPVWDKLSNKMSGFNLFIQELLSTMDNNYLPTDLTKVSKGTLTGVKNLAVIDNEDTITFIWLNNSNEGNASSSDKAHFVIFAINKKRFVYYFNPSITRQNENYSVSIPDDLLGDSFIGWMYFSQLTPQGLIYSDSSGKLAEHS